MLMGLSAPALAAADVALNPNLFGSPERASATVGQSRSAGPATDAEPGSAAMTMVTSTVATMVTSSLRNASSRRSADANLTVRGGSHSNHNTPKPFVPRFGQQTKSPSEFSTRSLFGEGMTTGKG